MKVLIVGANFRNKGAQSMLFTTVAMIRKSYPNAEIFFGNPSETPSLNKNFTFKEFYYTRTTFTVIQNDVRIQYPKISWCSLQDTTDILETSDLIVDISGFALGSKWNVAHCLGYLNNILVAKIFNIPVVLMPQSFGPFNFGKDQQIIDNAIKSTLDYPIKIFAREYDGYLPLSQKYNLQNVVLHPDLVLSAPPPPFRFENIFKRQPVIDVPKISSDESCVGIVPNLRSFDRSGDTWQTLQIFYEIINFLLKLNKRVYLFRHSYEDIYPCMWLKRLFKDEERVTLLTNDFSCFEYDAFCRQFDFLVAGRFHGIVHAYRNNIPCVMIGWAVKYVELSKLMYQTQYVFDVSAPNVDTQKILAAIKDMDDNLNSNKKILSERLNQIQQACTCFSVISQFLENVERKERLQ